MLRFLALALLAGMIAPMTLATSVEAGAKSYKKKTYKKYRGTKVRGFRQRRGGYSYSQDDVANTYGDSRTRFGGVNAFRDPFSDRQTKAGPFDHGWFFDSGVGPRGGDSPYLN